MSEPAKPTRIDECRQLLVRIDQTLHAAIDNGACVKDAHRDLHDMAHAFEIVVGGKPDDGVTTGGRDKGAVSPAKLTDDQIMQVLRKVTKDDLYKMLTCKRWKDGIDITLPTFAAQWLAEEFRALSAIAVKKEETDGTTNSI